MSVYVRCAGALAIALFWSLTSGGPAPAAVLATITGKIVDGDSSRPIPNAQITFVNSAENVRTQSVGDGTFSATLPAGTYKLTVQAKGFGSAIRDSVVISDEPLNVQVALFSGGSLKIIANVSVRTQGAINVTPAAVNTLTSQQIAAQGSIGLSRVLSEIPGVQITMAGSGTSLGSTFAYEYAVDSPANPVYIGIRGSQPYENATLYDGHRVNSTNWLGGFNGEDGQQAGVFNLANLDTNSISTLDIVKGPGANSPTINNAIGGVANIVPISPTGPPTGTLSYGFDGAGGLKFNIEAQGQSKNKRLGITFGATSYTISGPIGGFPGFDFNESSWHCFGILNGTEFIREAVPAQSAGESVLPPYIDGGFVENTATPAYVCCLRDFTRDITIQQNRSVSLSYNVAPAIQLTFRYQLTNNISNYSQTPSQVTFFAPPGYIGRIPSNYSFYEGAFGSSIPDRELDQLYEWDVHANIGKGYAHVSYLSYDSTNFTDKSSQSAYSCVNCTFSGEAIVGGTYDPSTEALTGGTLTIFNDQRVTLSSAFVGQTADFAKTLTHDIIAEFAYPIGNGTTAGISYNGTVTSGYYGGTINCLFAPDTPYGGELFAPFGLSQASGAGQFQRTNSLRAYVNTTVARNLDSEFSLYLNKYQYHIPSPNNPNYNPQTPSDFVDYFSNFSTPRFGFEWRPQSNVAIRASAGSSISPVDISQLLGQNQVPFPNPPPPRLPQFYCTTLANPNLKAETSFGEDLGASVRFGHDMTISTDLYNTTLHGQFFQNFAQDGTYLGLPLFATQTRNLAHSRYEGFELTIEQHPPTGIFWLLQGSLQRGFAYDLPANFYSSSGGPNTTNLTIISGANFSGGADGIGRVGYAQGFGVLGWENARGFSVNANLTYFGNNNGLFRPPFITVDLDGSIPVTQRASITVAVANLTNIYSSLYYATGPGSFAIIPYAHLQAGTSFIGQANTVANVGPRHISASLNFKL